MDVTPEQIEEYHVKSKGRITLGAEYEGKTVEIAILDVRER